MSHRRHWHTVLVSGSGTAGDDHADAASAPTVPGHRPYGDAVIGVVGVAVVDRLQGPSRLLAARRTGPGALAGGWELPGGKVKPGEGWQEAARRELCEELGVEVRLGAFLPGPGRGLLYPLGPQHAMAVWLAEVARGVAATGPDHDELRWLERAELYDVTWLPGDLPVVRALEPLLGS